MNFPSIPQINAQVLFPQCNVLAKKNKRIEYTITSFNVIKIFLVTENLFQRSFLGGKITVCEISRFGVLEIISR